jgi:cytochrome c biogenesis factor
MPFSRETLRSPVTIFLLYIGAAIVLVMGFRFIFPGETAPLPIFSSDWRLIRGALDLLGLFPALVFSALVVPFGIATYEDYPTSFSPKFFQRLIAPVVLAIAAAAVYGLVFFLLQPLARDFEQNMRYRGELYRLARERARLHAKEGEWLEASQFIGICDSVWPRSPELTMLRTDVDIHIDAAAFAAESERAEARERLAQASGASVMG